MTQPTRDHSATPSPVSCKTNSRHQAQRSTRNHSRLHSTLSVVLEIRESSIKRLAVCNEYSTLINDIPAQISCFLDLKSSPKRRAEYKGKVLEVLKADYPLDEVIREVKKVGRSDGVIYL
jgi:hypothetical protein